MLANHTYFINFLKMATSNQEERPRSETLNMKFGDLKVFASTSFTRAKQFTVEKLGRADSVTTYDDEFEYLIQQVQQIKTTTERILAQVYSMVQPNPGIRFESRVYSKLDRPQPHHSSPHEFLGAELSRGGNEFGPETQYGGYLVRCGEVETKIGASERKFQVKVYSEVITPLHAFLEVDIKNILAEQKILYVKRLDLDACRTAVKKAQIEEKLQKAENALRLVQADYDMQMEMVRKNMTKIVETHVNNLGHMKGLMSALKGHYTECLAHLEGVDTGIILTTPTSSVTTTESSKITFDELNVDEEDARKAKVLYDFEAENESQVTVLGGQIITVYPIEDDDDHYIAKLDDDSFGQIPKMYVELL